MAQKAHDMFASMGAVIDSLVYDELATVIGERLMDNGFCPSRSSFETLAEKPGDCVDHFDAVRAIGRLALDADATRSIRDARSLQAFMVEHLEQREPDSAPRERVRLDIIDAWLDADRTALAAAVQALWLLDRR